MRALLFAVLFAVTSGCHKNHDLFRDRQAELDRRLAEMQVRADNFNETRKALEVLELEVKQGLDEFPGAREQFAGLEDVPTTARPLPLPPLPPQSVFEGSDGERLRMRISDTERRIAELGKILGELDAFEARKRTLERKAAVLRALKN